MSGISQLAVILFPRDLVLPPSQVPTVMPTYPHTDTYAHIIENLNYKSGTLCSKKAATLFPAA